jgi:hypothetical protein
LNKTFQGFYFKQETGDHSIALIAARGRDASGNPFASIQAVLPDGTFSVPFPREAVRIGPGPDILLGDNRLNASGLSLSLAGGGRSIRGSLAFGPLLRPRYDIMGPFKYVPAMECRHHLVSLAHKVRGTLEVDGQLQTYDGAMGYIEGDSGRSFPTRYLWTHCFPPPGGPKSIMLSVAEIPWLGLRFTGVVGFILTDGREERIATYLGAKVLEVGNGCVTIRQGNDTLSVEFDRAGTTLLQAPVDGGMSRGIGESLKGRARYHLSRGGCTVFDFTSSSASFEYEYDR